jgi:hypothetical protein
MRLGLLAIVKVVAQIYQRRAKKCPERPSSRNTTATRPFQAFLDSTNLANRHYMG